jgi:hypothetical protein
MIYTENFVDEIFGVIGDKWIALPGARISRRRGE